MKIKSMEEIVENYVISTVQGAYKTKRYWMKKGFDKDHAIDNAINYAAGQLKAGVGGPCDIETAIEIFREIAEIANAFADSLEDVRE